MNVTIADPERMSMLGLMLASLLERRLAGRVPARLARFLRGTIVVNASGMQVTLSFDGSGVEVSREPPPGRPTAEIKGSLAGMLDAALGRDRVRHFLSGDLRVRGRPDCLVGLLLLLRA
jgi:hypothetical protein